MILYKSLEICISRRGVSEGVCINHWKYTAIPFGLRYNREKFGVSDDFFEVRLYKLLEIYTNCGCSPLKRQFSLNIVVTLCFLIVTLLCFSVFVLMCFCVMV